MRSVVKEEFKAGEIPSSFDRLLTSTLFFLILTSIKSNSPSHKQKAYSHSFPLCQQPVKI